MTNMDRRSSWTDEQTNTCVNLWLEGLSSSLIAARTGISRNAIIGKMHRLGLAKGTPGQAKFQINGAKQKRPGPPRKPRLSSLTGFATLDGHIGPRFAMPVSQPDDRARVSLADLEPHHCRFIPGEPSDGYCGLDRVPGSSYCAGHLQRCYVAVQRTRQMAAHDRVSGQDAVAAAAEEFLVPA